MMERTDIDYYRSAISDAVASNIHPIEIHRANVIAENGRDFMVALWAHEQICAIWKEHKKWHK